MKLSAHFRSEEFDLPPLGRPLRAGFVAVHYPKEWIAGRLTLLCAALEILRDELGGRPLRVLSGYRPDAYNRAIGGARRSQHVEGRAADILIDGVSANVVHNTALCLAQAGKMRIGGLGAYDGFTHIDVRNVPLEGPAPRLVRWSGSRSAT